MTNTRLTKNKRHRNMTNKRLATLGLLVSLISAPLVLLAEESFDFIAFAQFTAELPEENDRLSFGSDRLRLKATYETEKLTGRLHVDLNVDDFGTSPPGTLQNVIQDLWVRIPAIDGHTVTVGQFKTPLGMDFHRPADALLITKRGMEKPLVIERALGVMLSGSGPVVGLGYDVGVFNIAGRSGATAYEDNQNGDDNAWVGRVRYDFRDFHAEASYGHSANAGGPITADYAVYDVGFSYTGEKWTGVFEWIEGSDVLGVAGRDERVAYIHLGRRLSPRLELVARFYDGESEVDGTRSRLRNTYAGGNLRLFENSQSEGRLQLNYLFAGGDETAYTGVSGSRSDAILLQFQWLVHN